MMKKDSSFGIKCITHFLAVFVSFMETNSFGFVALDIMYAYPEDQGTYTCKATNALGEAVTQATLTCTSELYISSGNDVGQILTQ